MRRLVCLLYLPLLLAHEDSEEVVGIMGENFTFPVQIDRKIVEIVWKKNKDKVAEWEEHNKPTYFGHLIDRSVLMENGSLTIVNLKKDDAGTYELVYRVNVEDHQLNFKLNVLDSLPEPKISCNTSDGKLVLNCTANFPWLLNYTWKLSNNPQSYPNQELSIPLQNVDITTNATCIIKYSQTERSSEISLMQCLPEEKGDRSHKRHRSILISLFIAFVILVVILEFLRRKGIITCGIKRRTAQNNSPVNGSGEHEQLFPGNSQQQSNSEGAAFSHTVHCENENPEADRPLNENDRTLKDKQIVKNGVNQEEVTQEAEGENGGHPVNSSSCTEEDLKA
ncbi:lymphocyte function-associated antigen 3 isoform X2 [Passer montanus]|uniref:lymphocyte function-associated antigen 3 isoform X2 n=1 Tax=Passer montanus TaxID=9160 RepID=UPI001960151F|nr:lymphocyte function-associated antigen 3 isoform X2 [Passer montanus]